MFYRLMSAVEILLKVFGFCFLAPVQTSSVKVFNLIIILIAICQLLTQRVNLSSFVSCQLCVGGNRIYY